MKLFAHWQKKNKGSSVFYINSMLHQCLNFFLNLPYFLASLVPRKKEIWLFSAWFGEKYLDNPKYIFLYSLKQPGITAVWLTKDMDLFRRMRKEGLPVVYSASLEGYWLQLRCGVVVFTHNVYSEFTAYLIASRVLRIQAFHGIPLKKIGYDNEKKTKYKKLLQNISRKIFPYRTDRYDLVLATGAEHSNIFRSAFNVKNDEIVITGAPRNDAFFNVTRDMSHTGINTLKKLSRIIYMPTFRGRPGSEFPLLSKANFNYQIYDQLFKQAGIQFEIKLHPVQALSQIDAELINQCSNINLVDESDDIYLSLSHYDALVTDYSSIVFDFLLTGKPIYMAALDIDSYLLNDRSMYYNYSEICPSIIYGNWESLIDDLVQGDYDFRKYDELTRRFHTYNDGLSSKRAFEAIMQRNIS